MMDAQKRLYPTKKEEQAFRELKERYGIEDAAVAKETKIKNLPIPKERQAS